MNQERARKISQIYTFCYQLFPLITPVLLVGIVVFLWPGEKTYLRPTVVLVHEDGRVASLSCDADDPAHKQIVVDLTSRLAQVLFAYHQNERKSYAQKFEDFRRFIDPYGPAAKKIRDYVVSNLDKKNGKITQETSAFNLNRANIRSVQRGDKVYVTADGIRAFERSGGPEQMEVLLDITLTKGGQSEVFHVFDVEFRTKQ